MASHPEIEKHLKLNGVAIDSSQAGVTKILAANNSLDAKQRRELGNACAAMGLEMVSVAGDIKIRPKDSAL